MVSHNSLIVEMLHNLQEAERHDTRQYNLLLFGQTELVYDRHRKDQERKIRGNVEACIGKPQPQLIHAVAFDFRIPEVIRRIAQEDGRKRGPNAVDDDEPQHDRTDPSLGLGDSDTQILNRN
jgi:hypothetical protein